MPNQITPNANALALIAKLSELSEEAPAAAIKWYGGLSAEDKLQLLSAIALDIAQVQQLTYVVLRSAYALLGVLAQDVKEVENGNT